MNYEITDDSTQVVLEKDFFRNLSQEASEVPLEVDLLLRV